MFSSFADAPHKVCPTPIDEIIRRFKDLSLEDSNISRMDGQSAIVLYKGENSLVPYEGDFIKKRKPRPKVDLDPETERTWKLLMDKGVSEGLKGNDNEKEKWWENEREVFRGRVDSFIARMHLVQGTAHHIFNPTIIHEKYNSQSVILYLHKQLSFTFYFGYRHLF